MLEMVQYWTYNPFKTFRLFLTWNQSLKVKDISSNVLQIEVANESKFEIPSVATLWKVHILKISSLLIFVECGEFAIILRDAMHCTTRMNKMLLHNVNVGKTSN